MSCWIYDNNNVITGILIVQMIVLPLRCSLLLPSGHPRTCVHFASCFGRLLQLMTVADDNEDDDSDYIDMES